MVNRYDMLQGQRDGPPLDGLGVGCSILWGMIFAEDGMMLTRGLLGTRWIIVMAARGTVVGPVPAWFMARGSVSCGVRRFGPSLLLATMEGRL